MGRVVAQVVLHVRKLHNHERVSSMLSAVLRALIQYPPTRPWGRDTFELRR